MEGSTFAWSGEGLVRPMGGREMGHGVGEEGRHQENVTWWSTPIHSDLHFLKFY